MTMSSSTTAPKKQDHGHRPARVRAAALREQERRSERRRRRWMTAVVVGALVALVGGGAAFQASRTTADGPAAAPTGVTADGYGVLLGSADAPVLVEVYEDFMCPACGRFEKATGAALREMTANGSVRVVYRPMAFLDGASTARYSTRALNAAACAVDVGRFAQYHERLFATQPAEGGPGLSDAQLVALGTEAGITNKGFADCVDGLSFETWTQRATDAASKAGVVQTPTILVNGAALADTTLPGLQAAVLAAGS
jgi:protein-disulfide isomerase